MKNNFLSFVVIKINHSWDFGINLLFVNRVLILRLSVEPFLPICHHCQSCWVAQSVGISHFSYFCLFLFKMIVGDPVKSPWIILTKSWKQQTIYFYPRTTLIFGCKRNAGSEAIAQSFRLRPTDVSCWNIP